MSKKIKKLLFSFGLSVVVALVLGAAFWFGIFGTWQSKLTDKLFLVRRASSQIIILAIDDKSLKEIGQWPWPRQVHADALAHLAQGSPQVVGYDVIFSEPSARGTEDDEALAEALAKIKVVLPLEGSPLEIRKNEVPLANDLISSLEIFNKQAAGLGHVNVLADEDGVVRRIPAFIEWQGKKIPSFSKTLDSLVIHTAVPEDKTSRPDYSQDFLISYAGPPGSFGTISFIDVYKKRLSPEIFAGKIVLVGVTSPDLHDDAMTPFSLGQKMAGVEIHANALDTILSGIYLREAGFWCVLFCVFVLSLAVALIFCLIRRIWLAVVLSLGVWFLYMAVALVVFERGLILNLVYPSLAFVFSLLLTLAYYYFSESQERRYLRQSFQMYLDSGVIEEIIKDPGKLKLGGQRKEMTVLFSDIRGFTTLSEKTSPELLVGLLNEYFTAMTQVVFESGGVLDKFIGDAIMAFWGAPQDLPDHARRAGETALKMMERLVVLKKDWAARGLPEINIGVGINTGEMIVGNMGSDKRFDYTVIGDNVNLASRLEGLNKQYQTNIIISQFTYEKVKDDFECEYLDKVNVKGKEIAVEIYKLVGKKVKG